MLRNSCTLVHDFHASEAENKLRVKKTIKGRLRREVVDVDLRLNILMNPI